MLHYSTGKVTHFEKNMRKSIMTKMKCLKLKTPRGIQEYPAMPNMDAALP